MGAEMRDHNLETGKRRVCRLNDLAHALGDLKHEQSFLCILDNYMLTVYHRCGYEHGSSSPIGSEKPFHIDCIYEIYLKQMHQQLLQKKEKK